MPGRRTENFGDPVGNYNFSVTIDGVTAGHFMGVDGLSIENEVIEYQDGNDPLCRKRPGRVKYGDITLKKGYVASTILNDWIEQSRNGNGQYQRKGMAITLHDNAKQNASDTDHVIKSWSCYECFPKSWKMSALDGKGNDILTEEMVICIEWFEEA
jgi:phage tail-like protein